MKMFLWVAVLLAGTNTFAKEPDAPGQKPLLADTAFAEGFGAAFTYGKRDEDGMVRSYRDIAPWQVHLIPEGPVKQLDGFKTHPWDFQEGLHHNYTNQRGEYVRELHAHRLVVNHVIEANTREKLQFTQFNNDGLAKDDPQRDTKLSSVSPQIVAARSACSTTRRTRSATPPPPTRRSGRETLGRTSCSTSASKSPSLSPSISVSTLPSAFRWIK